MTGQRQGGFADGGIGGFSELAGLGVGRGGGGEITLEREARNKGQEVVQGIAQRGKAELGRDGKWSVEEGRRRGWQSWVEGKAARLSRGGSFGGGGS